MTACCTPRPAPNQSSAWPSVLAPFSSQIGRAVPARSIRSSGTESQPMVCACTIASRPCSTVPNTPTPSPSTSSGATPAARQDLGQPLVHLGHDRGRVRPGRGQRVLGGGQRPHREVEDLDPGAGLADVHADHVGVAGVDPQQRARPAAVGVDQPGLDHEPLVDELADDVADRPLAQPAGSAEVLAALRFAQVEAGQQDGAVVPAQIPDRTSHLHVIPSSAHRARRSTRFRCLDATLPHQLDASHNSSIKLTRGTHVPSFRRHPSAAAPAFAWGATWST